MSQAPLLKPEIPSGTLIDRRYIIQSLLGQGGLGRTYLALDTRRFNEPCVLKEFAPTGTGRHQLGECCNFFKREAKILYQFKHAQIPRFLAYFETEERLFLVQEFVDGKPYSTLLRERQSQGKTFTEQEVIQWLKNLLDILRYVHSNNIIHRDISPDNVMLPKGKNLPVLIDFGVGKQIGNINNGEHSQGKKFVGKLSLVGKLGYAPREQISLGLCFPSSDIYAVGVTAVVLLTGKDPSLLMDRYTLEWKWRCYVNVSKHFGRILDRMLADIYTNRYQTSEELLKDLENLAVTQTFTANCKGVGELSRSSSDFEDIFFENTSEEAEGLAPTIINTSSHSFNSSETVFSSPLSSKISHEQPSQNQPSQNQPSQNQISRNQRNTSLKLSFIQRCQDELAYYIGPIASLVIEDALVENPHLGPYQFLEVVSRGIPDLGEATKFIRDLMGVASRL